MDGWLLFFGVFGFWLFGYNVFGQGNGRNAPKMARNAPIFAFLAFAG